MVPVLGTYVEGGSAVVGAVWPPRFWLPCGGEPRGSRGETSYRKSGS